MIVMTPNIALLGGSFNPPGLHHLEILRALRSQFSHVIVAPSGPRPDKAATNDVSPLHRAFMVDLAFARMDGIEVDLSDLEENSFTSADGWRNRFGPEKEVSFVVAAPFVAGGANRQSLIHKQWESGPRLWETAHFTVLVNPGDKLNERDLPPRNFVCRINSETFSTHIRLKVFNHESIADLVTPTIADYIRRHGLYRGVVPGRETALQIDDPHLLPIVDERNAAAARLSREFLSHFYSDDPNLMVVVGGDGTMLHAIRNHWRRRIPFYGINTGHYGFLMNEREAGPFWQRELVVHQLPLLLVETESLTGAITRNYAFNDAWIERATGQTAWLRISINGEERLNEVVADGALVATAAGSSSYARAMGGPPVACNTPVMLLVGSNVLRPDNWRPVVLPLASQIEMASLDPEKRPLHAYIDGESMGIVKSMRVRTSRIAGVELAFSPDQDPALKLTKIQFPSRKE
jgi:NAD+ kinase